VDARPHLRLGALALLSALPLLVHAADGDLDPSFSTDGKAWYDWPGTLVQAETTAVLAFHDGSVVTAGWVDNGNDDRDFALVRFTPAGIPDPAFGSGGAVQHTFDAVAGGDDRAVGVFDAGAGRLLVVGSVDVGPSQPYRLPGLLRLLPNGDPDPAFGTGGRRLLDVHPFGAAASFNFKVARRAPDGRILVAGYCSNCGNGGPPDMVVLRLTAQGDPDPGFGNAGWANFGSVEGNFWLNEQANDVAVDALGRVLLVGSSELDSDPNEIVRPLVVRFTAAGELDDSFGDGGAQVLNLLGSWSAAAVAIAPASKRPLIAINLVNPGAATPAALLLRLTASGGLDDSYAAGNGVDLTREEGSHIDALVFREDGRLMAAGWIDPNGAGQQDFFLARVLADGTLDDSYDGNGVERVAFDIVTNSHDRATALALSRERAVVAGTLSAFHTDVHYATGVLRLQSALLFGNGFEQP